MWDCGLGSEVFSGRINDGFGPVVQKKFEELGSGSWVNRFRRHGCDCGRYPAVSWMTGPDFIAVTGGMSVDPDDLTPAAFETPEVT